MLLRSSDPVRLAAWCRNHLGFTATPAGEPDPDGNWMWEQETGSAVYSVFKADSAYFVADRQAMIKLRVAGVAAHSPV